MTTGRKVKAAMNKEFVVSKSRIKLTQGEMLRILREKNGLTQSQLAASSGLTQASISSLEADRISLGVERAKAIARILKVHPAVLVFPDWTSTEAA